MLMTLTLLSLLPRLPYGITLFHTCIPNSQFHVNGLLCFCDATGRWSEASCEISRRHACDPGQVLWKDCNQCVCQENGSLLCTNTLCGDNAATRPSRINKSIDMKKLWCKPFMSYYLNCSLCVCPVSGKMNEARCATDATCPFLGVTDYLTAIKDTVCIPKVMYLFPCLQCMCSDDGFFIVNKCVETCQKTTISDVTKRCMPRTFYRKNCNICFCSDNDMNNVNQCTNVRCGKRVITYSLVSLRNRTRKCHQQTFTGPKCFYCECRQNGTINEEVCLESKCMSIDKFNFNKTTCNPGEMVLKCMECFCPRNGITDPKYCTKDCTNNQKIFILEVAIKENFSNHQIVDNNLVRKLEANEVCKPNSVYKEQGRYCFCPDHGNTNFKLCTSVIEEIHTDKTKTKIRGNTIDIDFSVKCDSNTFVDFDCNTCYCLKSGRIDPKWCTYDDCESKKIILDRLKREKNDAAVNTSNGTCTPGSISKEECNFCICPKNGKIKDRACTENRCSRVRHKTINMLVCEPLSYYNVDCNICYCPQDGVKNVAKCTRNICEKNFLRSEACVPGSLFSESCNVCICPSNGDKSDRICTNNTCSESDTPWAKIFQLSHSLMGYQKISTTTRNLELCFPGEEFEVECKICICPDMGLRVYATCTQIPCDEDINTKEVTSDIELSYTPVSRMRRNDDYLGLNNFNSSEVKRCTPGSLFNIRYQQCICPDMGNISYFCRPIPDDVYCEQAYPNDKYMPAGRKDDEKEYVSTKIPLSTESNTEGAETIKHSHTAWACDKPGRLMDECFICECESGLIIREHCYQSKHSSCDNSWPAFINKIKSPEI